MARTCISDVSSLVHPRDQGARTEDVLSTGRPCCGQGHQLRLGDHGGDGGCGLLSCDFMSSQHHSEG